MGQSLWHIRTLSRCIPSPKGDDGHIGMTRCWRDWVSYKDRRVPRSVLEAVYNASGESLQFSEGSRDLTFGNETASWNLLDRWRDEAGDDSDQAGDDFELDGDEDWDLRDDTD